MDKTKRLLVVDDEESIRFTFENFLSDAGYQVDEASSLSEAAARVGDQEYDMVFLDILLGRESGMQLLRILHEQRPNCPVVMITGSPEIATAAESVRLGAFDYLVKPVQKDELLRIAKLALSHKEMTDRQETFRLRMAAVFASIQEGVLIYDEEFNLVDINGSAHRMLGCGQEVVGLPLEEIVARRNCRMFTNFQEIVTQRCMGEIYRVQMFGPAGEELLFSLTMSPLTGQSGRETGMVLVMRDESQPWRLFETNGG